MSTLTSPDLHKLKRAAKKPYKHHKSVTESVQRPTIHLYEDFKIRQIHYLGYFFNSRSRSRREVEVKVKFDYRYKHS